MVQALMAPVVPARGILALAGDDRVSFLQGLISNDVRRLAPERALWAALLTAQGKYLHDFFLYQHGETILIEGEGARIADLKKRLALYRLRAKVAIEDVTALWAVWVGWGEGTPAALGLTERGQATPLGQGIVAVDPRLAALGIRLIAPVATGFALLEAQGFVAGDWPDYQALRLRLGVPDGSRDLVPEKSILLENGFDELDGVAWDKGCYIGQELTARTKYRALIKKRLMPVRIDGALPAPGTPILGPDGQEAGELRAGAGGLALALIRLEALAKGERLMVGEAAVVPLPPAWLALASS
jgi:folate-binding protein YgfZ